jgi:hypothetical protein
MYSASALSANAVTVISRPAAIAVAFPTPYPNLTGHTAFCTTLLLRGNQLISDSCDETIRFWDMIVGFHDVGCVLFFFGFVKFSSFSNRTFGTKKTAAFASSHL